MQQALGKVHLKAVAGVNVLDALADGGEEPRSIEAASQARQGGNRILDRRLNRRLDREAQRRRRTQ